MARHVPGPLYFEQQGASGTPMLFIHSTPDDHRLWFYQTARFSAWYRTLAVDLAGYGRSAAPQPGARVADQAAACWEALDRVSPGPAIIHGNSLGSFVAIHMARQQPRRTLALVLSGCGYLPTREMMVRWAQRYRAEGLALRHGQVLDHFSPAARENQVVQWYARMVTELDNLGTLDGIIAMNEALSEPDPEELITGLAAPTIIMSGTADRNHPAAFELAKRIPGAEIVSIEGAGHSLMIEAPWDYDAHAIRFLTRLGLHP
jgi:3-oxoadipate enol-lactonase